jgi:sigma-B regulation protein RsbU (phosphoserine phosphatase)
MLLRGRIRLSYIFVALLAVYAFAQWGLKSNGLALLAGIALFITGAILLVRFCHRVIRQSIWRLRNRLYVTYVFIGVVPIVLILALGAVGCWILTGQIAVYLVTAELERRASALAAPAAMIAHTRAADRLTVTQQLDNMLRERIPGFQVEIAGTDGQGTLASGWKDYTGYIVRDGQYYSVAIVKAADATVAAMSPVDSSILRNLGPQIGAFRVGSQGRFEGVVPPAAAGFERLDLRVNWYGQVAIADWNKPQSRHGEVLWVTTRPSAVLGTVFSSGLDTAQDATGIFLGILFLLLLGEMVSLVIGISLTRTITSAVHNLYEGTQRIGEGDFSWRIPVKGHDQLTELGKSFNNMTAQIENLVGIAKEKERLQSEVQIAGEVQNQLFPRSAPAMRTIELVGVCHAARMVSGDYYDYLALPDGNLALAIGDVAGKGISAALLMASIQSIMRTQLAAGLARAATAGGPAIAGHLSTSNMVAQLNRQLYASTSPEKYATFFFGIYDDQTRVLTYTNAGHLQPLVLHNGQARQLEVTGTVVGAFPTMRYEEQTVQLHAGDLLIAYTDGVTEPENAYGEEFGADRLMETALRHQNSEPKEIIGKIIEAVTQWSSSPERPDDMTLIVARGTS